VVPEQIAACAVDRLVTNRKGDPNMGRALLLWLLGVPIPIIIIIALLYH
jgi:hypothetical protein